MSDWIKSTFSNPSGNSVEIKQSGGGWTLVRDSKDPTGPVLSFDPEEWESFLRGAKIGEFDVRA